MQAYKTYVRPGVVAKAFSVNTGTVKKWADCGLIEFIQTPGGQRRYDLDGYLATQEAARKLKEGPRVILTAVPPTKSKSAPRVKPVAPATISAPKANPAPAPKPIDLAAMVNAIAVGNLSTAQPGVSLGRSAV